MSTNKLIASALGITLVTLSASTIAQANQNPFAATEVSGYMVAGNFSDTKDSKPAETKDKEAKCGAEAKDKEGKCGEAKDTEAKDKEGKCGEGKCGEEKKDAEVKHG